MSLGLTTGPLLDDPFSRDDTAHESFTVWSTNGRGERSGGDWCAIVPIDEDAVALTIGDVAGHGVGSTARMSLVRASILAALDETHVPSDVLRAANAVALAGEGAIVTAIVAIFDRRRRRLTFANAGHPPPLVTTGADHAFLTSATADVPLGIFARHHSANYVAVLPHDSLVVMYSDGITEHARDPISGEAELVAAARWSFEHPRLDAARAIANRVLAHQRGSDDAAALVMRLSVAFHGIHDSRTASDAVR